MILYFIKDLSRVKNLRSEAVNTSIESIWINRRNHQKR